MGAIQLEGVKEMFSSLKDNPYYSVKVKRNIKNDNKYTRNKNIVLIHTNGLMRHE